MARARSCGMPPISMPNDRPIDTALSVSGSGCAMQSGAGLFPCSLPLELLPSTDHLRVFRVLDLYPARHLGREVLAVLPFADDALEVAPRSVDMALLVPFRFRARDTGRHR